MMTNIADESLTDDYVLLAGQPSLAGFVKFIKLRAAPGSWGDERAALQCWERAHHYLRQLESITAAEFERPASEPLSKALTELVEREECRREEQLPAPKQNWLPRRWAWVELDRLIVWQRQVNRTFASELSARIGESPADSDLLAIALGTRWSAPAVEVIRISENSFTFSSRSADLRFLEIVALNPATVLPARTGMPTHLIGVSVGLGPNLISVLEYGDRLILKNGTHRAYALRQAGIRRIPCLVETLPPNRAMDFLEGSELGQHLSLYTTGARPPLFKDYFDARLTTDIRVRRAQQVLHLQVNMQSLRAAVHESGY